MKVGNSSELSLGIGVQGSSNPIFISYEDGVMSAGAVFEIKAKKNGWITVFGKLAANKQYVVFEGKTSAVAYTLGMVTTNYVINYSLPTDRYGYIDFDAEDKTKYFIETDEGGTRPQFPYIVAGEKDLNDHNWSATGFLTFRVREGNTYYFSGIGSKMICSGFVFTDTLEEPTVTFCESTSYTEVTFASKMNPPALEPGEDFEYNGLSYTVIDDKTKICKTKDGGIIEGVVYPGNDCKGAIVIPSEVSDGNKQYTVVEIGYRSFAGTSITNVTLPESLQVIGQEGFGECQKLSNVKLPSYLTDIGRDAFINCTSLKSVTIPESVTSIEENAFKNCSGLTSVTLPATMSACEHGVFVNSKNINSVIYNARTPIASAEEFFDAVTYGIATLSTPNATLASVKSSVPWNKFHRIKASNGSVGFVKAGEDFDFNGIWYTVIDSIAMTCKTKDSGNKYIGDLVIPEYASYGSDKFKVIEIGKEGFSGSSRLYSVSLPSSIEIIDRKAFSDCKRLTSFVWKRHERLDGNVIDEIANPNLLLYVDNLNFAPEGINVNIVADGKCENLVLTHGYPFTPVSEFIANHCSMTKEFTQDTPIGGCAGWETILLPFDATSVSVSDTRGELTPFALVTDLNSQYPYWLYEADSKGEWKAGFGIKAGIPYLISMPNNPEYSVRYNIDGPVTFSNPSPTLITTETTSPYAVTWASGRQFRSLWTSLDEEEAKNAMGLNSEIDNLRDDAGQLLAPGSAFHIDVMPKPLEAYVTRQGAQRVFRINGDASGVLPVLDEKGICMSEQDGALIISSAYDRTFGIYTPAGIIVKRIALKAGESCCVRNLTPGIYIVGGHKVAVK